MIKKITHNGKTLTPDEWDFVLDFPVGTVSRRVNINRWDEIRALTEPLHTRSSAGRRGARTSPWRYEKNFSKEQVRKHLRIRKQAQPA